MKRFVPWFGILIATAALLLFARQAAHTYAQVAPDLSLRFAAALSAATLLWLPLLPIIARVWQRVSGGLGAGLPYVRAVLLLGLSQMAKYLPGNVGHHLGRGWLAAREGVPVEASALAIVIEALLLVATALLLATLLLARGLGPGVPGSWPAWALAAAVIALLLAAAALLHPPLADRLRATARRLAAVPPRIFVSGAAAFLACFALMGAAFQVLFLGLGVTADWAHLTGVIAASWVVGFLFPGAPAGLGVRELAILALLDPGYPEVAAMSAVLGLRAVTTLADLFWFTLCGVGYRRASKGRADGA